MDFGTASQRRRCSRVLKGISVRFARLLGESPGHAETLTTVAGLVAIGEPSIRFEAVFALDDIVAARERLEEDTSAEGS
jgi:hypothetical protein